MFNVGGGELIVIALIALVVLGPNRLPEAARQAGKVMADLRRISSGFQNEVRTAFDEVQREQEPKQDFVPGSLGGPGATSDDLSAAIASVSGQIPPEVLDPDLAADAGAAEVPADRTPAKRAPAKRAPATRGAAKEAPAKKAPAKKAPAKQASAKRAPAQPAASKQAPAKRAAAKTAPSKAAAATKNTTVKAAPVSKRSPARKAAG